MSAPQITPCADLPQLAATVRASDIFVFRRVSSTRFVHVGGFGRGESWAGDVELDCAADPLAFQVQVERPLRIQHSEPRHIFGPYYAVAAAAVRMNRDTLVIFGATAPESDFNETAAKLKTVAANAAALVDDLTPAKRLADELEILHACQTLTNRHRPGDSLEQALRDAAEVAADALGCEIALTWLPDGRFHLHGAAPSLADRDRFPPIMQQLWKSRADLPRRVQDAREVPLAAPLDPESGVRAYLVLGIGEPTIALLLVAHTEAAPRGFSELCVRLGTRLASTASTGLATAMLRERLLRAAAKETKAREELAQANRELAQAAEHDPLTTLPNRVLLQRCVERLGPAHPPSRDGDASLANPALLYVDLDDFKSINDTYGHAVGDSVLVEVARRLQASCRPNDIAARIAGDEFALLMVDPLTDEQALAVANRLVRAVSVPFLVEDKVITIGTSVGVAPYLLMTSSDGRHPPLDTLLHRADLAMYRAKTRGRGRAELYTERTTAPAITQSRRWSDDPALGRRLRAAQDEGELRLRYRPTVDLLTGEVLALEAFIDWPTQVGAKLSAAQLIAVAERTGLIRLLDEWALRKSGRQLADWDAAAPTGAVGPVVTVSVRPAQLGDPDFLDALTDTLETTGLSPSRLRLQLAESGVGSHRDELVATLRQLHDSGMQIAIGGFGAGPSSLTLMRRLPLDWVQIDEEIIGRLDVEPTDMVMVRLIVESAHSLGLRVCAEGVSRHAQIESLAAMGCDAAQGDLLGAAVEPALVDTRTRAVNTIIAPAADHPLLGSRGQLTTLVDGSGTITYASAESLPMLGYHPAELVGTAAMELVLPGYRQRVVAPFLHNDGSARHPTHALVHKDGSTVWVEATHQSIRDPETRRLRHVLTTAIDVSERVRAEAALSEQAGRLRSAFDCAPHAAVIVSTQGIVLEANTAVVDLLGRGKADLLGRRFADFVDGSEAPALAVLDALRDAGNDAERHVRQEHLLHADGRAIPADVIFRIITAEGEPSHLVGYINVRNDGDD